jgi:glutamate racemase
MIGIFDSGIGGLTVVKALMALRPDLPYVYLGDTARTPYGAKSPETVRRYAEEAARFLLSKGAEAVVIACNTASSLAADHLRALHPGLPIFDVVSPAVRAALAATANGRIGLIGTRATVGSGEYERRLKEARPEIEVLSAAAPLLVSLVEEGWLEAPETASIVGKYVAPLREKGIDTLILGCTHYPLLKGLIAERAGKGVRLIDSAETVAREFCATIEGDKALEAALRRRGRSSYFVTDPTPAFAAVGSAWLGESIVAEVCDLGRHLTPDT